MPDDESFLCIYVNNELAAEFRMLPGDDVKVCLGTVSTEDFTSADRDSVVYHRRPEGSRRKADRKRPGK